MNNRGRGSLHAAFLCMAVVFAICGVCSWDCGNLLIGEAAASEGDAADEISWTPITSDTSDSAITSGGYYRLETGDVALDGLLTISLTDGGTVVIDLNGYELSVSTTVSTTSVIRVTAGSLTIQDSSEDQTGTIRGNGTIVSSKSYYGIINFAGTELVLKSGTITGGLAYRGGGVYVTSGTFTMEGGTITGNTATALGGGVCMYGSSTVFTMKGGTISDNVCTAQGYMSGGAYTNDGYSQGGGLFSSGTVYMEGGTISGNRAASGAGMVINSSATISGGSIINNSAGGDLVELTKSTRAGAIFCNNGTVRITGGTITGNSVTSYTKSDGTEVVGYGGGIVNIGSGQLILGEDGTASVTVKVSGNTADGAASNVYLGTSNIVLESDLEGSSVGVTLSSSTGSFADTNGCSQNGAFFSDSDPSLAIREIDGVLYFWGGSTDSSLAFRMTADYGSGEETYYFDTLEGVLRHASTTSTSTIVMQEDTELSAAVSTVENTDVVIRSEYTMTVASGSTVRFTVVSGSSLAIESLTIVESDSADLSLYVYGTLTLGASGSESGPAIRSEGTASGSTSLISVADSGALVMYGGTVSGNMSTSNGAGVSVTSGTFDMYGGTISGNSTSIGSSGYAGGGGVLAGEGSTFSMHGGTISGNSSSYNGGGVTVYNGTFVMTGGSIEGNTALYGAGVYVHTGGAFVMTGGSITGNTAVSDGTDTAHGGGVASTRTGTVTIGADGTDSVTVTVSGNTADSAASNMYLGSGGMSIASDLAGSSIGITLSAGTGSFASTGGHSCAGLFSDSAEYSVLNRGATLYIWNGSTDSTKPYALTADFGGGEATYYFDTLPDALGSAPTDGTEASIVLQADAALDSSLSTTKGTNVILSSEHEITVGTGATVTFTVVSGSTLTIKSLTITEPDTACFSLSVSGTLVLGDDSGSGPTIRSTGTTEDSASFVSVASGGLLEMHSGTISGNRVSKTGGGGAVYVASGGTFRMYGGTISGNHSTGSGSTSGGGGVYVTGTFTMLGGTITGNIATSGGGYGGGVQVYYGTFSMYDGAAISGNESKFGGGVGVNHGTFTMHGGTISGNTAASNGGGIYQSSGTSSMSGGTIGGTDGGNTVTSGSGGGAYILSGSFNLSGGTVSCNTAAYSGAVVIYGTMTMSGGTIESNRTTYAGSGAVVVSTSGSHVGSLAMTGGEISGNCLGASGTASFRGVYFSSGTLSVSGTPVIGDGVTLGSNRITLAGDLESGAGIVILDTVSGVLQVTAAETGTEHYLASYAYFSYGGTAPSAGTIVSEADPDSGYVQLRLYYTLTLSLANVGADRADSTLVASGEGVTVALSAVTGYSIPASVTVSIGGAAGASFDVTDGGFTIDSMTGDAVVTASGAAHSYTVSYSNVETAVASDTVRYDGTVTLPTAADVTKTGCTLTGWSIGGTEYGPGQELDGSVLYRGKDAVVTLTAVWTVNTHAVTYVSDGSEYRKVEDVAYGSTVTLIDAPSKTGYTASWTTADATISSGAFQMPDSDVTVTAVWTANSYTIGFDPDGGTGSMDGMSMAYDETDRLTANAFTRTGYAFAGWRDAGGNDYADGAVVSNLSSEDGAVVTLYARWTANAYTISYDLNGAEGTVESTPATYDSPAGITGTVPVRAGYAFGGWNTAADGSGTTYSTGESVTNLAAEGTVTLYAVWSLIAYTVTVSGAGIETATGSIDAENGTEIRLTALAGYTLPSSYTLEGATYSDGVVAVPAGASDVALTVNADPTVFFDSDGGTAVSSESVSYGSAAAEPSSPAKEGYTFAGWYTSAERTEEYDFDSPVTAAITLYALWDPIGYTISFSSGGDYGEMDPIEAEYGAEYTISSTFARTGYTLAGWSDTEGGSSVYDADATVSNLSSVDGSTVILYAVWTANAYTIGFDPNGGTGSMDAMPMTYDEAGNLTGNAFTRTGYAFAGWRDADGNGYGDGAEVSNLSSEDGGVVILYAQWTANAYTISYDLNGAEGSVDRTPATYDVPVSISEAVPARTGYAFGGWNTAADGSGTTYSTGESVTNLAAEGTVTLYAVWSLIGYTVTVSGAGIETATGSIDVENGAEIRLTALAGYSLPSGCELAGATYSDGVVAVPAGASDVALTVNADPTVYFDSDGGTDVPSATVSYGSAVSEPSPAPAKDGCVLVGWYTSAAYDEIYDFDSPVTGTLTLHALWATVSGGGIEIPATEDGGTSTAVVPSGIIGSASEGGDSVTISGTEATVELSNAAVRTLADWKGAITVVVSRIAETGHGDYVYDLTVLCGDQEVTQFQGAVTVTFHDVAIPEGSTAVVYWIDGDAMTEMPTTVSGTSVSFTTTHFSTYAVYLVEEDGGFVPLPDNRTDGGGVEVTPGTSDSGDGSVKVAACAAAAVAAAIMACLIAFDTRRRRSP